MGRFREVKTTQKFGPSLLSPLPLPQFHFGFTANLKVELSIQVISFADKQIDFHPDFKLFLCTKNQHIVIPSSIRNVLSEVNFTTTRSGLTSQARKFIIPLPRAFRVQ